MKKIFLISLLLVGLISVNAQVLNWRGENSAGIFDQKGLLEKWPENGPKMLWSITDLPTGYSSPSIGYNTIYLTGTKDSSDYLIALDLKGNIKWQTPYGKAWLNNYRESRSTPTIHNKKIYVTSGMGEVVCMDAKKGNIIWKLDAHEVYEGRFGRFGLAESVLIDEEKVFYTTGGDKTTMIAINKNNGKVIWTSESLNDTPAYASPLLIKRNGKKIVVQFTKKYLFGINPANGKILWKFDYGQYAGRRAYNNHSNTPIYYDGGIYISSGYNHKSILLSITDDLSSVKVKWINETLDNHHGGIVKIGNYLYGSSWDNNANGKWVCVDWNTGETKYEELWHNKGQIIAANGYLYLYDEKFGNVGLVKADPNEFKVISSFQITLGKRGPHWTHPIINDGILYMRHGDAFMAYDIRK